ncbi:hypothetical protein FQZ97_1258890 [compost metagenome]
MVLPVKIRWQVEFAGAPRDTDATADAHEPIVLGQRLARFAHKLVELGEAIVQLGNHAIQHLLGNRRVAPVAVELLFLPVDILEHIGLHVGT